MKLLKLLMALVLMFALVLAPAPAVADPGMEETGNGSVLVEGYEVTRWDDSNPGNTWSQTDDDLHQYHCGWADNSSAVCEDRADGALYGCSYTGGRMFCQYYGGGLVLAAAERQRMANTLARGIGNRGTIARPKYGPSVQGFGPHCS